MVVARAEWGAGEAENGAYQGWEWRKGVQGLPDSTCPRPPEGAPSAECQELPSAGPCPGSRAPPRDAPCQAPPRVSQDLQRNPCQGRPKSPPRAAGQTGQSYQEAQERAQRARAGTQRGHTRRATEARHWGPLGRVLARCPRASGPAGPGQGARRPGPRASQESWSWGRRMGRAEGQGHTRHHAANRPLQVQGGSRPGRGEERKRHGASRGRGGEKGHLSCQVCD